MSAAAHKHCQGRLLAFHEGGYSEFYVPFCGLAVVEEMSGFRTEVKDPSLGDAENWGYQAMQPWQQAVIDKVKEGPLALLQEMMAGGVAAGKL
jgi:acetoin utilization deacetylase AcuC-like enzyme